MKTNTPKSPKGDLVLPPSFNNHGTSAQRVCWLKKGATSGRFTDGDTFSSDYAAL